MPSSSVSVCDADKISSTAIVPTIVTLPSGVEFVVMPPILLIVESYWIKVSVPWLIETVPLSSIDNLSVISIGRK